MQQGPLLSDFSFSETPQSPQSQEEKMPGRRTISFDGSFCIMDKPNKNSYEKKALKVYLSAEFVKHLEREIVKEKPSMKTLRKRATSRGLLVEKGTKGVPQLMSKKGHFQDFVLPTSTNHQQGRMSVGKKHLSQDLLAPSSSRKPDHQQASFSDSKKMTKHRRTDSFRAALEKAIFSAKKEPPTETSKATSDSEYGSSSTCGSSAQKGSSEANLKNRMRSQIQSISEYFGPCFKGAKVGCEKKGPPASRPSVPLSAALQGRVLLTERSLPQYSVLVEAALHPHQSDKGFRHIESSRESGQGNGLHLRVQAPAPCKSKADGHVACKRKRNEKTTLT